MKNKIFNAQQVQSIISGNKRMFREVIKPYPVLSDDKSYWEFKGVRWAGEKSSYAKNFGNNARPEMPDLCPYQVGQKIFCKESFFKSFSNTYYRANIHDNGLSWKLAQHMKQEHSRLTLQIKEVRVEKLSEISEEDAIKEGMEKTGCLYLEGKTLDENKWIKTEISDFAKNWNATHKKPEEKFEANPWVFVYQFEVVK